MEKVFAPIKANSLVIEFFIESIAVKIPTNAVIPTAIIITVKIVLNKLLRIESKAIRIFSARKSTQHLSDSVSLLGKRFIISE